MARKEGERREMKPEKEMTEILKRYNGELLRFCGKRKQEGKDCKGCPCGHKEFGCVVGIIEELIWVMYLLQS